ncbi:cysteine and histidine-rich protein 1-like isoform X2 [Ostrinia furnacalis]|uniref:cysteine and histidine-rich protein 1-like isoform X2 n=1 Tax=Ostrinia furnacalis TaxID=93504 RepID=UPI00103BC88E|nr:cysteine and histidine-rich protein 1-like isoform X2 [Ostrinia furnacalis]
MAEAPESEPVPSSSEPAVECDAKEDEGPLLKKRKLADKETTEKLEHRLGGILCCTVCLDLPPAAVFQCSNGHLMCAPCFNHLLADARLRDESATCPNCRVDISKTLASRNLAVEKTVSELPSECKYCTQMFPRHSLQHHEDKTCEDRLTGCRYECIGCPWRGAAHEAGAHEAACAHPRKPAADVADVLAERERRAKDHAAVYTQLLDLLSYEKITFNEFSESPAARGWPRTAAAMVQEKICQQISGLDGNCGVFVDLQLKPYRTEEYVHKLYYETSRFTAFGHQWVVKAFVNKNQRDPTQSSEREITYQIILKSKPSSPLPLQWLWLRGPYGEAACTPRALAHAFSDDAPDAPPLPLPLADPADANRLLLNKAIQFRLIMFLATK